MDDLDTLARDFGFGSRGKANPMRSSVADHPRPDSRSSADDPLFNDVFSGPSKYSSSSYSSANSHNKKSFMGEFDHDSIFGSSEPKRNDTSSSKVSSSLPVYDKPVYDEDIFDGLPGVKSKPAAPIKLDEDVFASISPPPSMKNRNQYSDFSDLLGNLGRNEKVAESNKSTNAKSSTATQDFDDLLGGFGAGSSANSKSPILESKWGPSPASGPKHSSGVVGDPFVVLESTSTTGSSSSKLFTDPLEDISKLGQSRDTGAEVFSSAGGGAFSDLDPLNKFSNPVRPYSPRRDNGVKDVSPQSEIPQSVFNREMKGRSSFGSSDNNMEKRVPVDKFQEHPSFDVPDASLDFRKSVNHTASAPIYDETSSHIDMNHTSSGQGQQFEDIWLTVSEIPLLTQPTNSPPPSRPPPPIPQRTSRSEGGSFSSSSRKKDDGFFSPPSYSQHSQSPKFTQPAVKESPVSQLNEFENFAMGFPPQNSFDGIDNLHSSEETNAVSAAAAIKEAMDKAEAKFRQAKEVREREYAKSVKNKESMQMEKDEQDSGFRETLEKLEHERNRKEDEERERIRFEREREREREREKARQVVERANREARERAAFEARERTASEARLKMERAAVQRAQAEARERAAAEAKEKAQKAAAEARERAAAAEAKERAEKAAAEARERVAAAEAKERAEKVAAEARERAAAAEAREKEAANKASALRAEAEVRRRAERAAFERASAEARERAAAEAREKMAAAEKANQQGYEDDLDSIFGMGRASSAPRSRENSTNKGAFDSSNRTSVSTGVPSNIKKASSTSNIVDDLSSIFGAAPPSEDFQEVEGESEERRKARYDRVQRTRERAAKALAEKNQRDIQTKKDQEERYRFSETLDVEIKRWAAGKEGNLRALLSTLQYVLWPECGWQPVSLTDLIMGASVKKAYRKATLCIHPDKVQQKGATLQQKYIAEKVFDLLKEAWNKFNSEELF